jgi:murein DD-endopeptidase MepM/ murein hydrolase activator NlpD
VSLRRLIGVLVAACALSAPAAAMVDVPIERTVAAGQYPLLAPHDYGTENNGFGGLRDHGGQDIFADCGVPVLAAQAGKVTRAEYEGAAGNYAVVTEPSGRSEVYMHLQHPATAGEGDDVAAGERIGTVGRTGDADGCHLHFELWTAPGWFKGAAIDPLPALERWDR